MKKRSADNAVRCRPLATAVVVFLIAAAAAATLLWRLETYRLEEARSNVANTAADHAYTLQRHLERAFSASYALAALVRQGDGVVPHFDEVASQMLPFYPGVAALELIPDGIVRSVVPRAGNEGALGHNVLGDPVRNREAFLARDTGKLTLAGPFDLVQGGSGVVARLPVFLDRKEGRRFWGFTAVLVRFPESLAPARLSEIQEEGLEFQLWRIHPDTNRKQIIASSSSRPLIQPVEQSLALPNGTWTLSVAPRKGWGDPLGFSLKASLGLLFSLLLAWLAKLLVESTTRKEELEVLVERRAAQHRESEVRLRLLGDNLPNSYIYQLLPEQEQFLHVSAGVEKVHGVKREDVLRDGSTLYRQIDPDQLPLLVAAETESKRNMADFHMELRMRRSDGEWRWLHLRSRPRRREDGTILWDGVATDITAEKEVEEALRHERDFSDALLNALPGVFYLSDNRLNLLRWNENFERVVGRTGAEIVRMSPLDFFSGEQRNLVKKRIEDAFHEGAADVEADLVARDGTARSYYFTGVRTRIAERDCLLGVGIDITRRKKIENDLEAARVMAVQEKTYLEGIMEVLPVGVAIRDVRGEYIRTNQMFREVWRGSSSGFRNFTDFKAWFVETGKPVGREEWPSARALWKDEKIVGQLLKIERLDGTEGYIHASAAPFHDAEGRVAGCAVAVMDLTEQMEIKESLRVSKEAAEAANVAKTQFLANMSHELRTPMTAILGVLQLALEEDLAPATRDYLETILNSARALLRVLNDILDMTNIAAGRLRIEEKPFGLRRCVSEAFDVFVLEARRKGLNISLTVDDGVPEAAVGDQVRLRQVLINLVGNAVKFTRKGHVEVQVSRGGTTPEGKREVVFVVRDTGIGVPDDKKDLLFHAFTQVDPSHSRSFGGTGLGLAISKEIVDRLGGEISFASEEGIGTTVSFSIPLTVPGLESAAAAVAEAGPTGTEPHGDEGEDAPRILLAEDDPTIRELFAQILRKLNYRLDTAEDGMEAVEMWEKGEYDLVLMDIQMPRLNGFEATGLIRAKEKERGRRTAIVAVTAHALKEDEQRCADAGMDAYISKPINFQKAFGVIREILKQRSSHHSS